MIISCQESFFHWLQSNLYINVYVSLTIYIVLVFFPKITFSLRNNIEDSTWNSLSPYLKLEVYLTSCVKFDEIRLPQGDFPPDHKKGYVRWSGRGYWLAVDWPCHIVLFFMISDEFVNPLWEPGSALFLCEIVGNFLEVINLMENLILPVYHLLKERESNLALPGLLLSLGKNVR